jgi:hypothetical protein
LPSCDTDCARAVTFEGAKITGIDIVTEPAHLAELDVKIG